MHTVKAYKAYSLCYNVHNLMYYSNKCQLFCIHEQLAGGKRGHGMQVITET